MAVSFASDTTRRTWQAAVLASALHIGVAIVIGWWIARPGGDGPWVLAAIIYAGFLALSLIWWVSRQLVALLVWRVIWRRAAVNDLVASFQGARLPRPDSYLSSADRYFEAVVNDEGLRFETRMAAGAHWLRVTEFARQQGMFAAVRSAKLYEDAIAAYRDALPTEPA